MASVSCTSSCAAYSDIQITATLNVTAGSQSVANNYTTINYSYSAKRNNYDFTGTTRTKAGVLKVIINGSEVVSVYVPLEKYSAGGTYCSGSGSVNVYHNNDGTKSFTYQIKIDQGVDDWGKINWYWNSSASSSPSMTLTTIPRTTGISSVNFSDIHNSFKVNFTAASSSFGHDVLMSGAGQDMSWNTSSHNYGSGGALSFTDAQRLAIYNHLVSNNKTSVSFTVTLRTWSGSTHIGSSTSTVTFTRAGISSVSTNQSSYNTGNTISVTVGRNNSNYTHALYYYLNDNHLGTTYPGTSDSYSVSATTFGSKLPNSWSGTLKLVLYTYYSSCCIGSNQTTATINLPDYSLTTPKMSLTVNHANDVVRNWGIAVQGYFTFTATLSGASGKYSSSINKYTIYGSNRGTSNTYTSGTITSNSNISVSGNYTDSRGKTSPSANGSITVYPYSNPSVTLSLAQRWDGSKYSDEGTQVRVQAAWGISSVNSKNSVKTAKAYIRESTVSSWTELGDVANNTVKAFSNVTLSINKTYQVMVRVTDQLSCTDSVITTVPTATAIIDILSGGTGMAIGKMAGEANLLDIAWDTRIGGNTKIKGTTEIDGTFAAGRNIIRNSSSGEAADVVLALGYKTGYPLYTDPTFASGSNSVNVYNNAGNGTVTHYRYGGSTSGNGSGYGIRITTNGYASPGLGGFYHSITSGANKVFVQLFRAMLPVGYYFEKAHNALGTGGFAEWLTSSAGTGKYEWYAIRYICGPSGSFSTGGHVYVHGGSSPVTWYLLYANVYDVTNGAYDGLRTRYADIAEAITQSVINGLFPVNSIYITYNNNNPGNFLGGTWTLIGHDRAIRGAGLSWSGGAQGGSWTSGATTITASQMPKHNHYTNTGRGYTDFMRVVGVVGRDITANHTVSYSGGAYTDVINTNNYPGGNHYHEISMDGAGESHTHNICASPFIALYIWRRTA